MKTVLFIHGFSAKMEDNIYLLEYLEKKKNIRIKTFTLPGHTEHGVEKITYDKWIKKAEEELLETLKETKKVILIGHSMGGAIATILAAKYPQVEKLILIAPAFTVGSLIQNREDIKDVVLRKKHPFGTGFEGVLRKLFTVPFSDLKEVRKIATLANSILVQVKCPILLLHGTIDQVVPISSSIEIYAKIKGEKQFTILTDVRHQVFKSEKKEEIAKYIYTYIVGGIHFKLRRKEHI
jgi:esterase/lipase